MARHRNDQGVPQCPDHPDSWVVRNGLYGVAGRKRQRWRCTPDLAGPYPGQPHNFTGVNSARFVLEEPTRCASCEQLRHRHEGPSVCVNYRYALGDGAQALIKVGEGLTYPEVARRIQSGEGSSQTRNDQLVRHWVDVFAPVVLAPYAETSWPKVIAVDSTSFFPGYTGRVGFSVLAVVGYEDDKDPGRVVALKAVKGGAGKADWAALFATLAGSPEVIVSDGAKAQLLATSAFPKPPLVRHCRWHELRGPRDLLTRRGTLIPNADHAWKTISRSTYNLRRWVNLMADLAPHTTGWNPSQLSQLNNWYQQRQAPLTHELFQSQQRGVSWAWTTGRVEWALQEVRAAIDSRSFGLRNAKRTALLLDLIRVRLNRTDRFDNYINAISEELHRPTVRMVSQRLNNDPAGQPSLHPF